MANEIQELKFQVGEAWKGVYSPSTAYGLANVVQDPTGLSIYRSLKSGNVGHPLSNASWWFRIIDLSSIKAESDRIAALNQAIAQDEALRVAAEELRQQHEAERVAAETQRNEAEQQRISAEEQRVNKESQREAAEQQRITAEQGRVSAESARVQAEQARVLAETLRANAEDQRAANEQNRVAAEQQRIERAEQDHQRAESDHATYVDSLGAFDISSYHATDGVLAKYADLTAALGTGGANIPDDLRKGGMSVKFVQSSDNKYVQYRLMSETWNINTDNWSFCGDDVLIENPEWIDVTTDKDGRVLAGIKPDGSVEWSKGVPTPIKKYINNDLPYIKDGKGLIDIEFSNHIESIENPEWMEVDVDDDDKVLGGRKTNGVKIEEVGLETPFIKTKSLQFTDNGLSEFQQTLIDNGFVPGGMGNRSDDSFIVLPIPTAPAIINITAERFPQSTDELEGVMSFYDRNGNFFTKNIEGIAIQGQTTTVLAKKSIKFDFSDCKIKFGDWVPQDSFHLKAHYIDIFRGKSNLAYDYWREIIKFNHSDSYTKPYLNGADYDAYNGDGNLNNNFSEARLTPDGFAVELYFNGSFLGLYTWNLKKDKDNYNMKKTKTSNIHIDPGNFSSFLNGVSIDWTSFEIRNPKPKLSKDGWQITDVDGNTYNPDAPKELIGSDSAGYDSTNLSHTKSNEIKQNIISFFNACSAVVTNNDKATFETYFSPEWFTDLILFANIIMDGDSLGRNTQYITWGGKWYPVPYDCDQIFGTGWKGNFIYRKSTRIVDSTVLGNSAGVFRQFITLYKDELDARYKELRDSGIASTKRWVDMLSSYMNHIGKDLYEKEFDRWPITPCNRQPNDNPQWEFMGDYYEGNTKPASWDANTAYTVGQYVTVTINGIGDFYYRCKENCQGIRPYTEAYNDGTAIGGYFDSLTRTQKWLEARFVFLDTYFNYNN